MTIRFGLVWKGIYDFNQKVYVFSGAAGQKVTIIDIQIESDHQLSNIIRVIPYRRTEAHA